jgi:hypothetical protein
MLSENSYVVGKKPQNRIECHIFVSDNCPLTDAEVKDILADRKGNNSPLPLLMHGTRIEELILFE